LPERKGRGGGRFRFSETEREQRVLSLLEQPRFGWLGIRGARRRSEEEESVRYPRLSFSFIRYNGGRGPQKDRIIETTQEGKKKKQPKKQSTKDEKSTQSGK